MLRVRPSARALCAGLIQNVYSRGKRADAWNRLAIVKACYNKSMTWLLRKPVKEQVIRWQLAKEQAAAERAEHGTVNARKRNTITVRCRACARFGEAGDCSAIFRAHSRSHANHSLERDARPQRG